MKTLPFFLRLHLSLAAVFFPFFAHAEGLEKILKEISPDSYATDLATVTGVTPFREKGRNRTIKDRFLEENLELTRTYLKRRLNGMGFETIHTDDFDLTDYREPYVKKNRQVRPKGKNYWVDYSGTDRSGEIITLGAHYDSTGAGMPGANDNGSGFAAVMNIAQALAAQMKAGVRPSRTIRIVFFDGEEMPPFFQGSKYFFEVSAAKGEKNVLFVNVDMIGYSPSGLPYVGYAGRFHPRAARLLRAANESGKLGLNLVPYDPYLSDNLSATWHGIPSIALFEEARDSRGRPVEGYAHYHKATDTLDRVNQPYALGVARWALATTWLAAQGNERFENTPLQRGRQLFDVAEGFRDDDEPAIARTWDRLLLKDCRDGIANFIPKKSAH